MALGLEEAQAHYRALSEWAREHADLHEQWVREHWDEMTYGERDVHSHVVEVLRNAEAGALEYLRRLP